MLFVILALVDKNQHLFYFILFVLGIILWYFSMVAIVVRVSLSLSLVVIKDGFTSNIQKFSIRIIIRIIRGIWWKAGIRVEDLACGTTCTSEGLIAANRSWILDWLDFGGHFNNTLLLYEVCSVYLLIIPKTVTISSTSLSVLSS